MTTIAPAPATTEVTTRDVLHRAADLLEEWGWRQRGYGCHEFGSSLPTGAMCIAGAFTIAWRNLRDPHILTGAAEIELAGMLDILPHRWNDDPSRTREEAIAKLREAAERA